jgi:hypothetical protein
MENLIILCEKCCFPIGRTEFRTEIQNGKRVTVELYICINPLCHHIEKVYPDDLTLPTSEELLQAGLTSQL